MVVEKSGMTVMIDKEIEEISREEIIDETNSYQSKSIYIRNKVEDKGTKWYCESNAYLSKHI